MKQTDTLKYFFKKSPLVRAFTLILVIAAVLGGIFIFKYNTKPVPYIDAITPPVGSPGDIVVISGKNFGRNRDMNYVEFSGSKLTASSYLMWTDNTIRLVVPSNVQNGLVVVGTGKLRSKPAFFANVTDIPVEVQDNVQTVLPYINSLKMENVSQAINKVKVGDLISIEGNNFGDSKGQSKVYFNADFGGRDYIPSSPEFMMPVWEDDFSYEYWSNSEIKVRVPDGAVSGYVIVETSSGLSNPFEIQLDERAGHKAFSGNRKMFLVQYTVDVSDVVAKDTSTITLRCPLPLICPNQLDVQLTEVSPQPILENYQKTLIHQLMIEKNLVGRKYFTQAFVIPVSEIKTEVNEKYVSTVNNSLSDVLYAISTRADELIPSENDAVVSLASTICKSEKNPYRQATLIYNYMISNYTIENQFRKSDANPLDLLGKKSGDAYDFAIIFTALLRAVDIPAFADCGVLVSPDSSTRNHMWAEFYLSGIGWIPVDVALGAGMEYDKWDDAIDEKEFYFGNLDSHHIKFSRGINTLKPFAQDNKIVIRPRSFAFQTFWEEATKGTEKYSSFWSDPVVKGIY